MPSPPWVAPASLPSPVEGDTIADRLSGHYRWTATPEGQEASLSRSEVFRTCERQEMIGEAESVKSENERKKLAEVEIRGGAEGTRTPDFLRAREALSQLSYSPETDRYVV